MRSDVLVAVTEPASPHGQRGDMETRIRRCQADLFADRTPAATMRADQLPPWLCPALRAEPHRSCWHRIGGWSYPSDDLPRP